ncbi:response regulator [Aurantiacibacter gilvus]|uniref:Response regulator n=1 Tax=Aurantiacibacter gilvus TaxID=3139141 RepID=A0ABU9IBW2_9SPHN
MKTILVLEDEPLIAMDLRYAVEDLGFEVLAAIDNDEALAAIEGREVDGAILDVSLGAGKTCEPTASELHARAIPFILHTGDLDRVGETLRAIGAPIMPKPSPSDVVANRLVDQMREKT